MFGACDRPTTTLPPLAVRLSTRPRGLREALHNSLARMSSPHVSDSEPERELARSHSPMRRARANVTHSEQKRLDTASNLVHEFPQPKPVPVSLETRPSKYFNNGIELDIDEGDNSSTSLPPPIDIRRASSRSVSPPAAAQSRCTEAASSESPETSPRSKFARHLSSHFVYQPNSKGTSHNNYFATHSSSAAAPKSAHVPEASSSKSIVHDNKKKRAASKAPKAADFDTTITGILPLQVIGLVELCPVCKLRWTTRKTPAVKLAHMLSCAKENDYDLDTVRYLVDRHIRELHQQEEQQRLVNEPDKSLFDQVIRGAGKGVLRGGKAAKVQVVGLDAGAAASTQGGTLHNNVSGTQVSKEIDRSKRKLRPPTSKLSKAIKLLDADIPATGDPTPTSSEQSLHRQPSSKSLQAKTKPPGKLQPYTQSKDRLAQKAHQMFASGQLNPSPPLLSQSLPPSVSVANVISSNLAHKSTSLASGQLPLHTFAPVSASKGKARQVIELDDDDDDDDDDTDLELQPLELGACSLHHRFLSTHIFQQTILTHHHQRSL